MRLLAIPLVFSMVASLHGSAKTTQYRSALVDEKGQLHVALISGGETLPPKFHNQVAFGEALLSQDRRTVGWLAYYAYPGDSDHAADPIPGRLVLYRYGHVLRSFTTEQVFWSWRFAHRDHDVAYCTGPTHGGGGECELRDITSGHLLARWFPDGKGNPPVWARDLHF
jgi:hypothetical protein